MYKVLQGERPDIPPRQALPGPDGAAFTGLEEYCQLMRWVRQLMGCMLVWV